MASTQTFTLKYPFEHGGQKYDKLVGRRPKVRELTIFLKKVDRDPTGALNEALANLFEIPIGAFEELDLEDYGPIKKWFEGFMRPLVETETID